MGQLKTPVFEIMACQSHSLNWSFLMPKSSIKSFYISKNWEGRVECYWSPQWASMPIATSLIYNVRHESRRRASRRGEERGVGYSKECITVCSETGLNNYGNRGWWLPTVSGTTDMAVSYTSQLNIVLSNRIEPIIFNLYYLLRIAARYSLISTYWNTC